MTLVDYTTTANMDPHTVHVHLCWYSLVDQGAVVVVDWGQGSVWLGTLETR